MMNLAYTITEHKGDLDLLLASLADELAAKGMKTAGIVQINSEREACHPCDMDVQVLPDGPVIRISQSLGAEAKGCRLDPAALETAVGEVSARLGADVDVLIINKFGKHEASGRGMRSVIATALAQDIPVIAGVNALNREAFLEFSEGLAVQVAPEVGALGAWLSGTREKAAEVA